MSLFDTCGWSEPRLYHLNAYTYADPTWFPDMDPDLRAMFTRVTRGALSGNAGEAAKEDFKINGQYVNTSDKGVVGIPFFDEYVEKASLDYLDRHANSGQNGDFSLYVWAYWPKAVLDDS